MKLSAIQTTQSYAYKKNNNRKIASQPAFKSIVTIERGLKEPFLKLAELVKPALSKLDKNLKIEILELNIWRMFRADIKGLKFNIKYVDQKLAYHNILKRNEKNPFLKPETIKGLKDKDEGLLWRFNDSGRVGYCFNPKKETEEQFIKKSLACVKKEIDDMPKKLLEHPKMVRRADGTFYFDEDLELLAYPPYTIYK